MPPIARQLPSRLVAPASSALPRTRQLVQHLQHRRNPAIAPPSPSPPTARAFSSSKLAAMAPIPKTMRAVVIEKTGGVEVLEYKTDVPIPTPKDGEVLVKNAFAGINYIDTYFRSGLYPAPKPEILGRDGEGTVVAVGGGDTSGFKEGDYVVWMATGGYAEYSAVPVNRAHVVPAGLEPGAACAVLLQGLTALTMIRESYAVQPGDWILVHAAAGGVGLLLCQLLAAIGAKVIGTASTPEKLALAKAHGASVLINYKDTGLGDEFTKQVMDVTGGEGVAAVFDGVGASTFDSDLAVTKLKGTVVSFGNASGAVAPLDLRRLAPKNLKVLRPQVFGYISTREEWDSYGTELLSFVQKGQLKVQIHKAYALEDIRQVHTDLEGRLTTGKLLLKL